MFESRVVKTSKILRYQAQRLLHYKRDTLKEPERESLEAGISSLKAKIRAGDKGEIQKESEALDQLLHRLSPSDRTRHWRENCELILVYLVVVLSIRCYFVQPFRIPTGSMQPTLNGIIGHRSFVAREDEIPVDQRPGYEKRADGWYWQSYPADGSKPNIVRQVLEFLVFGRNYINVVSDEDDRIEQIVPKKVAVFLTFSRIVCEKQSFLVYASPDTLRQDFKVLPGGRYRKGDVIARGAIDTGDQVLVDKFSYNFVRPRRGDVFVFRTDNIPGIPGDPETGEHSFYIKRLAGLPGNTLRIDPPLLYADGKLAEGFGFARVMAAKPPYHGYAAGRDYLSNSTKTFPVPPHSYFAMGDNSEHSYDSRWWGPVPEPNLVGRGLFVYWPFTWHWGIIR